MERFGWSGRQARPAQRFEGMLGLGLLESFYVVEFGGASRRKGSRFRMRPTTKAL